MTATDRFGRTMEKVQGPARRRNALLRVAIAVSLIGSVVSCGGDGSGAIVWVESAAPSDVVVRVIGGVPGDTSERVTSLIPAGSPLSKMALVVFNGQREASLISGQVLVFDRDCNKVQSFEIKKGALHLTIGADGVAAIIDYGLFGGPYDVPLLASTGGLCEA